jgi:hypothetical protein
MRSTIQGLASEIGWTEKAFAKAFQEAFRKGMAEADERACYIGLPNFLRYNGPESPNVVKSWGSSLDLIPECRLKNILIQRVKGFAKGLPEAFQEALPEAFRKSMPNQEPEPEPEQEQDPPNPPRGADAAEASFELFWQAYPRHTKKAAAFKSWQQIKPEEIEPILAALSWQTKQPGWVKENGKYIPHPSTWLNDRRWEDEPPQAVKPKPNEPEDDLNRSLRMMREQGDDWGETQNG